MSEHRMSRRELFKSASGLGLAFVGCEGGRAQEKQPTSLVATEVFRSQREKIDYTGEKKEITPEIKELLFKLQDFRQLVRKQYQIHSGSEAVPNTIISKQIQKTDDGHSQHIELLSAKKTMAEYLKRFFPKLGGGYSEESFYHCLLHEIPVLLSQYGIFAKPMPTYAFRSDNRAFTLIDAFLAVFPVRKVMRQNDVEQWGRSFQRDILEVDRGLMLDGKSLNSGQDVYAKGQAFYQNIVIYGGDNDSKKSEKIQFGPEMMRLVDEFGELDNGQLLELASRVGDTRQDQLAFALSFTKMGRKVLGENISDEDATNMTIAHESRHLIDQKEQIFADRFTPPLSSDALTVFGQIGNNGVHEEINGLLGQLRYSKKPCYALFDMMHWLGGDVKSDFQHDRAVQWVFDKMIEKILSRPSNFGVVIDDSSAVSARNQATLQLNEVVGKTEIFYGMVEEIMAYHESHYDENFSDEYIASLNFPKNHVSDREDYWPVAAGGILAILAALEVLRRRKKHLASQDSGDVKSDAATSESKQKKRRKEKRRRR